MSTDRASTYPRVLAECRVGRIDRVGEGRVVVAAHESGVGLGQCGLARGEVGSGERVGQLPGQAVGVPAAPERGA